MTLLCSQIQFLYFVLLFFYIFSLFYYFICIFFTRIFLINSNKIRQAIFAAFKKEMILIMNVTI